MGSPKRTHEEEESDGPAKKLPRAAAPPHKILVSELDSIVDRLMVTGRVDSKSEIRESVVYGKKLRYLNFIVTDKSGAITCVAHDTEAATLHEQLEVGKTVSLTHFQMRPTNKTYNAAVNNYKIVITAATEIVGCEEIIEAAVHSHKFKYLADLHDEKESNAVNVKGVIKKVHPVEERLTAEKKSLKLRSVVLMDKHKTTMNLALWNDRAEAFEFQVGDHIEIVNAGLKDFMGVRGLKVLPSTSITRTKAAAGGKK